MSDALSASNRQLLMDCRTALGDWVTTYASPYCSDESVNCAFGRIAANGGTLAYVGRLIERINATLVKP